MILDNLLVEGRLMTLKSAERRTNSVGSLSSESGCIFLKADYLPRSLQQYFCALLPRSVPGEHELHSQVESDYICHFYKCNPK